MWKPTNAGNYTLTALAKDGNGTEVSQTINAFSVVTLDIKDIKTSLEAPQKIGETISLSMDIDNTAGLDISCYYEISGDGDNEKLEATNGGEADWTPKKHGKYKITGYVESGETKISKTIEFEIEEENKEKLVIYYHSTDPQDINYAIASEGGTIDELEMIGDTMQSDNSMDDYEYRYEIDLADNEVAVLSFLNSTNGEIDDNDGEYYVLKAGTYGIKRGQVYNLSDNSYDNNQNNNGNNGQNNNHNNGNHSNNDEDEEDEGITWDTFFNRDNN